MGVLLSVGVPPRTCAQSPAFKVLHTFAGTVVLRTNAAGASPYGALVSSDGVIYGATAAGGDFGSGTVFEINADGTGFTNLHSFATTDNPGYTNLNPASKSVIRA
ncbi:MAG: hypothetical protein KGJ60_02490 [Verrucomicrobiota bacterium]|nr:hypothetical protein [Verrucomicrobiota bacterium]